MADIGGKVKADCEMGWPGEYGSFGELASVASCRTVIELYKASLLRDQRRRKKSIEGITTGAFGLAATSASEVGCVTDMIAKQERVVEGCRDLTLWLSEIGDRIDGTHLLDLHFSLQHPFVLMPKKTKVPVLL